MQLTATGRPWGKATEDNDFEKLNKAVDDIIKNAKIANLSRETLNQMVKNSLMKEHPGEEHKEFREWAFNMFSTRIDEAESKKGTP